ncbi:hypothetical protein BKA62DRAFT_776936 [Auriculariales sp. MPI-PUGE-AT-0066]|nr:hypothetical protein BKA62DRAFT_776936 [Auriculariales sp. MPI-PUGE-AT-0066]
MSSASVRSGQCIRSGGAMLATSSQGQAFWAQCVVNDDIISGLQAWSDNGSGSSSMSLSSVDSVVVKHRGAGVPLRPCFLVSYSRIDRQAEVLVLATFGRRPAGYLDRLTQHYVLSVPPTPAFPEGAPCAITEPAWPHDNQYLLLVGVFLDFRLIHKPYKNNQYQLQDVNKLAILAMRKTREFMLWSRDHREELREEWKQQRKKIKKAYRKRTRHSKGQRSLPGTVLSISSQSIAEDDKEADHVKETAPTGEATASTAPSAIGQAGPKLRAAATSQTARRHLTPVPAGPTAPSPAPTVIPAPAAVPSTSATALPQPPSTPNPRGSAETRRTNERRTKKRILSRLAKLNIFGGDHESIA